MIDRAEAVLVGAVAAVGVLHTVVPDHWVPITLVARQRGWTRREVARAALVAGTGHTISTLAIGLVVWLAGVAFATRFGNAVSTVSSIALIAFGVWVAFSSLRDLRGAGHGHEHAHRHKRAHDSTRISEGTPYSASTDPHAHESTSDHGHDRDDEADHDHGPVRRRAHDDELYVPSSAGTAVMTRHAHAHRHRGSTVHVHLHDHGPETWHRTTGETVSDPPLHEHEHGHKREQRTALLFILGSSPMVEGIPAFFSAAKFGFGLIAVMAAVFACATMLTYVGLCVASVDGLRRISFGPIERYGEAFSGAVIALVGLIFLLFPIV